MSNVKFGIPVLAGVLGLLALYVWQVYGLHFVQDDAYITLVVARNLVSGNGPVFVPGEVVEGYTSPLWMLVAAIATALFEHPIDVVQGLGIVFGAIVPVLVVLWTWNLSTFLPQRVRFVTSFGSGFLLVLQPAYVYWCSSAMESSLFLLLIVGTLLAYHHRPRGYVWSALLATLVVLRPESMLLFSLLAIWHLATTKQLAQLVLPMVALAALLTWRFMYYGELLPNTFAAKTPGLSQQGSAGIEYAIAFIQHVWIWGIGVLTIVAGAVRYRSSALLLPTGIAVVWLAAVTILGGDVLPHQRFLLPVLVLTLPVCVLGIVAIVGWLQQSTIAIVLATIAIGAASAWSERDAIQRSIEVEGDLVSKMLRTGAHIRVLSQHEGKPLTIAATTIGALAWSSNMPVIDMLGLTDKTIATQPELIEGISNVSLSWKERKYNASYVLGRKPDYIVFSTGIKPSAYAERALLARQFYVDYYQYYFPLVGSSDLQVMFRRKPQSVINRSPQQQSTGSNDSVAWVHMYVQALDVLRSVDRRGEAIARFEQLTSGVPDNFSWVHQQLGDAAAERGDAVAATLWYTEALRRDPCDIRSHFGMFQLARSNRDANAARLHGDWVTRCNPQLFTILGINVPANVH